MAALALFIVALTFCSSVFGQQLSGGIVVFNQRGISGTITFSEEDGVSNRIRVTADLLGLRGFHNWHVHRFPVDHTVNPIDQCQGAWVGGHYDPFNANMRDINYPADCLNDNTLCEAGDLSNKLGQLGTSGQLTGVDDSGTLYLSGRYSIIGRSVVIHDADDNTNFVCGTIRPLEEVVGGASFTLLQATFISPVAGTIYLRQVGERDVQMWGRLFWVDETSVTTGGHNWHIHEDAPPETYRIGQCPSSDVGPHFDPTLNGPTSRANYSDMCSPDMIDGCELGDLTGKHGQVFVAATPIDYSTLAFFYTDPGIDLIDSSNPSLSVLSDPPKSIAIHSAITSSDIIACAPLVESEKLSLSQLPERDFELSQDGPFEDTVITTNNIPSLDLSILSPAFLPGTNCLSGVGEIVPDADDVYEPYTPYEGFGEDTSDRYPLGDLNNRYSLDSTDVMRVFRMPVYGKDATVSNKPLRRIGTEDRQCSTLFPSSFNNMVAAKATFSNTVNGAIYLLQSDFSAGITGYTYIIVDLYYRSPTQTRTSGHNWHIHQLPPVTGMECMGTIGGHYNPFDVNLDPEQYGVECTRDYPLRCESGDLSSKHGQLEIAALSDERPTYSYVDPNLHLSGSYSVIGRSIGLHDPAALGGDLFECAQVERFYFSQGTLRVSVSEGVYSRVALVQQLTSGTAIDPSDVVTLDETVVDECVTFTAHVLGDTPANADSNLNVVMEQALSIPSQCGAASFSLSLLLLALCLLLAFTAH